MDRSLYSSHADLFGTLVEAGQSLAAVGIWLQMLRHVNQQMILEKTSGDATITETIDDLAAVCASMLDSIPSMGLVLDSFKNGSADDLDVATDVHTEITRTIGFRCSPADYNGRERDHEVAAQDTERWRTFFRAVLRDETGAKLAAMVKEFEEEYYGGGQGYSWIETWW